MKNYLKVLFDFIFYFSKDEIKKSFHIVIAIKLCYNFTYKTLNKG